MSAVGDWIKNNVSVLITIITLAAGGFASYIRIQDELQILSGKVAGIEKDGTETTRNLEKKVAGLETQNNELATQMRETKEVLNKIDRRVAYLICKQDKKFCFGE